MCSESTYDVSTFGSPWPYRSYQLAFYNEFIAPHQEIYGKTFDVYAEIQADGGNVSDADIRKRLDEVKLIRKNFVRINVLCHSYSSFVLEENPSMSVDQLTSNVGGTPSLWMGITTTLFVDVIELLWNILIHIKSLILHVYHAYKN